jgi:hypothetical protein
MAASQVMGLRRNVAGEMETFVTPANPQIIFREAMNVRNPTSGLLLRSHRQSIEYARGNATQKKNRVQKSAKNNACP